jgi:DNA polymerase III delta subunit
MHQQSLSQHSQKQNKRKNAAILILLLSKPYVFNILLLVFSQKPSEKKLQRKKPIIEARKHGH